MLGAAAGLLAATVLARSGDVTAQAPAAQTPAAGLSAAALNQYCVTCHNDRLKTAGLVIDVAGLATIGEHAETWEKVVRKLRTTSMPPAGARRPDAATYHAVASFLESELDRAADARPQLPSVPLTHRLSRTEYGNAVRDLLALEALPREVEIDILLPPDNVSSGFDNIADLLFISPSNMERYLDAARKISRLAVGDPQMPPLVNIHRLNPEHPQDERVEALPVGTRGGLAVRSEFPVDGRYVVKVELAATPRERHDLEVTVDGARVALRTLGEEGGRGGRGRGGAGAAAPIEFPLTLTAGPKVVGVAFLQRTEAQDEATLRPRMRSRGTQPAIAAVTISGPYDAVAGTDSPSRRRIFTCHPPSPSGLRRDEPPSPASAEATAKSRRSSPAIEASEGGCAREILSTLARRAYRRPVTEVDLRDLLPFYDLGRRERDFDYGIQRALERLLVSSQFLFRIERPSATAAPGALYRVSDIELASRLSFFLWSSIPDDELLDAAIAGRLREPAVLEQQVRRMLADRRADALVTNFAAQWLYLRDLETKRPDEILFADFDETLRQAMQRETELFIGSVFGEDRSVIELLTANYTFLNERLARHYGIPNVRGSHFRRVTLPEGSVRGGLLGLGSVLTITSYATRTSPVIRGKWVLENLLSSAPPPPPPDIPSLSTDGAEREKPLTLRDAMVRHRANPSCAGCHARMDPIGFAMDNFDAIGRWRDTDGGTPIDASGTFPDGTKFQGITGLKQELLRQREQFAGTVAEKLLMYAIGRNVHYYDGPAVRAIVRDGAARDYAFSSLVLGVVKSRPFQMRQAGAE
jgi:mono/diheme cytochrome c family protein